MLCLCLLLQGVLRLYCVPACFLQPADAPPLLEQRLGPQLRDLAAGVPLQQPLAGTIPKGVHPMVQGSTVYWYPCPPLHSKFNPSKAQRYLASVGSALNLMAAAVCLSPSRCWDHHQQQQQQLCQSQLQQVQERDQQEQKQ
jgi:hypothetical protein